MASGRNVGMRVYMAETARNCQPRGRVIAAPAGFKANCAGRLETIRVTFP